MVLEFQDGEMSSRIQYHFNSFEDAEGWLCECFNLDGPPDWVADEADSPNIWVRQMFGLVGDKRRLRFLTKLIDMGIADKYNVTDNWTKENRVDLHRLDKNPLKQQRPRRR